MDKQILFLYSAINGYLDWLPVNLIPTYEQNLYSFYDNSSFELPLSYQLTPKNNSLDQDLVPFFIWYFTAEFINFSVEFLDFQLA